MARVNHRMNQIAELNRKQQELKTVAGKIKAKRDKQALVEAAAPITAKLEPKKTRQRKISVKPDVPAPVDHKQTPAEAYEAFTKSIIDMNVSVIEVTLYKVVGPKGELVVYFRQEESGSWWHVGKNLRDFPLASSRDKYRALAWAQKSLIGAKL